MHKKSRFFSDKGALMWDVLSGCSDDKSGNEGLSYIGWWCKVCFRAEDIDIVEIKANFSLVSFWLDAISIA